MWALPIIVPNLMLADVARAISRTGNDAVRVEAFATTLGRLPKVTVVPLDEALGYEARALAAPYGLPETDAVCAAVARQAGRTLISLDLEYLTRLGRSQWSALLRRCSPS